MDQSLDRRFLLGGLAGAAGISALAAMAKAGPLNPPAGAVSSTGKTLAQVEPRIPISASTTPGFSTNIFVLPTAGSYYLTDNITVPAGQTAILAPGEATIDLNGFTIRGLGFDSALIAANGTVTVRNGFMRGGESCINSFDECLVEDLRFGGSGSRSVRVGLRSVIRRCLFRGSSPIHAEIIGDHGLIEDCILADASALNVYLNSFSTLRNCAIGGAAAVSGGARVGYGSRVEGCAFRACSATALTALDRVTIDGCSAADTAGANAIGFDVGVGCTITRSTFANNRTGVRAGSASRIADCTFDGHAVVAAKLNAGSIVEACTFTRNALAVDATTAANNFIHRCVMLGNSASITATPGNWYTNVNANASAGTTNPLVNIVS